MQSNTLITPVGADHADPDKALKRGDYLKRRQLKRLIRLKSESLKVTGSTDAAGEIAERYFMMFVERTNFPPWIKGFRKATPHQDFTKATDAIAILANDGKIRIQIKSSERGRMDFEREHPDSVIVCIVINYTQEEDELKEMIVSKIKEVAFRLYPELFD